MALTTIKTGGLADNSVTDAKVADAITVTGAQTGITQVGTLTAGTWNGTAIASAYLDADTAHLSGSTFTGSVQVSHGTTPDFTLNDTGGTTNKRVFRISGGGDAVYFEGRNNDNSGDGASGTIQTLSLSDSSVTFAGQLKIDTDQRYFTKWETTYGTDRDYWWRNDGGLLQLGEGAEGDAQVKYTFDTANKRLGIGLTAPTDPLHVKTTAVETRISLESSTGKWAIGAEDNDKFGILNYGTSTPFIIDSSGNVGINTSSPDQIFHIKNTGTHTTMRIENDNADFLIQAGNAGDDGLHFYDLDNSAYRMTIDNAGQVGIGTTSPGELFHILGSSDPTLKIQHSGASTISIGAGGAAFINSSANLAFKTNGSTEAMRIDNNQNVGIGTTSPTSPSGYSTTLALSAGGQGPAITLNDSTQTNKVKYILNQDGELKIGKMELGGGGVTHQLIIGTGGASTFYGNGASGANLIMDNTQAPNRLAEIKIDGDNGSGDGGAMLSLYRNSSKNWSFYARNNTIVGTTDAFVLLDAGDDDGVYINQGGSGWSDASDERLKTSFVPIENAVDKLNTLQAINFKWKYGSEERQTKNNIGLLAQEVYEVFPEAVDYHDPEDFHLIDHPTIEGTKQAQCAWGIDKSKLIPVLIKAVQELSAKVEALENA